MQTLKQSDPINDFIAVANKHFSVYMDVAHGFKLLNNSAMKRLSEFERTKTNPHATCHMTFIPKNADIKNMPRTISNEEMQEKINDSIGYSTPQDIIHRCSIEGESSALVKRMVISSIYDFWEDYYREKIARFLELPKPEQPTDPDARPIPYKAILAVDALGDIRHFRNSIVHHHGYAYEQISEARVFKWFQHGEEINFTYDQMVTIKKYINEELRNDCLPMKSL